MMGMEAMQFAGLAPAATTECSIEVRSVMGVSLPQVTMRVNPLPFPYSPAGISAVFDELRIKWIDAGKILGSWTEISGSVWRVAAELGRTQRRVKALENLLIPKYQAAIRRIQVILDEQERESLVRTKRVKEQRER
jgi:V/A-type H+-transporting ATPase subunit D